MVGKRYVIASNEQGLEALTVNRSDANGTTLTLRFQGQDRVVPCGAGNWVKGQLKFGIFPDRLVASSAAWTGNDTLVAKLSFPETPYTFTLKMKFTGNDLELTPESNVAIFPMHLARWMGRGE